MVQRVKVLINALDGWHSKEQLDSCTMALHNCITERYNRGYNMVDHILFSKCKRSIVWRFTICELITPFVITLGILQLVGLFGGQSQPGLPTTLKIINKEHIANRKLIFLYDLLVCSYDCITSTVDNLNESWKNEFNGITNLVEHPTMMKPPGKQPY